MSNKWEELPKDLLRKIDDRLILYIDKVRLRCVCKSWQSELSSPSQFKHPLILLPSKLDEASHELFDFTDGTTYYLDLRKLHEFGSISFRGSSHGWVVATAGKGTSVYKSVFLFNPLTGLTLQLPSNSSNHRRNFPARLRKCIVSSNPSLSEDYMVVAKHGCLQTLAYTKCGDDHWNEIKTPEHIADIIFYEGRLFGLTYDAQLMLIEIGSSNPLVIRMLPHKLGYFDNIVNCLHLVDSRIGLLMVEGIEEESRVDKTSRFNVYKYDFKAGQWSSKLTNIGDDMLFVGLKGSVSILLKDCNTPTRFKENYIHFFDYDFEHWSGLDAIRAGVFDLKTGKQIEESLVFRCNNPATPIWFTTS